MIRIPESVSYEELPAEKRYGTATKALPARIGALYRRAVDEFGADALELVRSVNREHGRDLALELCDSQTPHDAGTAAVCLARMLDLIDMEGELTEISPGEARIRIEKCPYGITDPELCEARTALESEFLRTLNSDLTLDIERCAARGDSYCQFRIAEE